MRMNEAKALIDRAAGYRVSFERREGHLLISDYFPERNEPPIADEGDAWKLARGFAMVDPLVYVNVYVIHAEDFSPVAGYDAKKLNRYPELAIDQAVTNSHEDPQ